MSHRLMDDIEDLRLRIAILDDEIAVRMADRIVDLVIMIGIKRRREEMLSHLARLQEDK